MIVRRERQSALGPRCPCMFLPGVPTTNTRLWLLFISQLLRVVFRQSSLERWGNISRWRRETCFCWLSRQCRSPGVVFLPCKCSPCICWCPSWASWYYVHEIQEARGPKVDDQNAAADTAAAITFYLCLRVWSSVCIHEILTCFLLVWKKKNLINSLIPCRVPVNVYLQNRPYNVHLYYSKALVTSALAHIPDWMYKLFFILGFCLSI